MSNELNPLVIIALTTIHNHDHSKYNHKMINNKNLAKEECLICKDDVYEFLKLNCNHFYCLECLLKWLNSVRSKKCCLCQKNISFHKACYLTN